ncbi:MAG: hypothetical protein ACE5I7_02245 [Candidatus Binatia bacterium]
MARSPRRLRRPPARQASPAAAPRALPAHRIRIACLLGVLCFFVYASNLRSMGTWAWDSIPARLLPFSILREGNLDFGEFHWLFRLYPKPYFLRKTRGGAFLSAYSIGVPVLVTPLYIPVVWWLQRSRIPDDDVRFRLIVVGMERVSAALIAAVSVSLVFLALTRLTSAAIAAGIALLYGLGTSMWVIGSQTLLQHGGAALGLAGMSLFLVGPDTRRHALVAGGFAALAVLARPTMIVFSLLALVFMWRERRRNVLPFLSVPIAGMLALLAYNARLPSLTRGGYRRLHFALPRLKRLAGLLLSPNRGLFIYTPAAVLALPIGIARRAALPRWVTYLPIGIAAYLILYSAWQGWWGGNCYGPRFLTDVLPAIALCAVPAVERLWRARLGRGLLLAVVAWGVAVQAIGVYWDDNSWNTALTRRLHLARRAWDWKDLQILRAARAGWHGSELAPLLWQALTDPRPALLKRLKAADLSGEITVEGSLPLRYPPRGSATVHLWVTNRGGATWPVFSDYGYLQCKLGYRWWAHGTLLAVSGAVPLPRNLGPGESTQAAARIYMPRQPGTYELELVVVQVLDADKGLSGGAVARVPVQIE